MQPTEAIDLFLVLAADFVVLAAREGFVFFSELITLLAKQFSIGWVVNLVGIRTMRVCIILAGLWWDAC